MAVAVEPQPVATPDWQFASLPPLENGDRLTAREFLRRYEAMPHIKKAELIEGVVYMGSPVRIKQHARPDGIIQTWLGLYAVETPGTENATNATSRLDVDNVPQPDGLLRIVSECGGCSRVDEDGYLDGAPELAVEVCASSASIDLGDKRAAYRRAGVLEYLVWRTEERKFDWFVLADEVYQSNPPDAAGIIRSRVFPGLWLAVNALLAIDAPKVMDALRKGLASSDHADFVAKLTASNKR